MSKPPSHEEILLEAQTSKIKASEAKPEEPSEPGPELVTSSNFSFGQRELVGLVGDRYEILENLGSGGMSTVYKVLHIHLDKVLALKILQKAKDSSSILRFKQEAKASSRLEHPNIVRVHDFGATADGQAYMTMDYLKGRSLSEIIKSEGGLNPMRVCQLFGQISGALAHAHEQKVIHRDLKPSNIMITSNQDDGSEQAIVVDFGIAKIMDTADDTNSKSNLTQTGDIFGTPLYMSPEQCQGQKVDARSDIYSLGCLMYEAVTGIPPFQGDSIYHIIHQQITEAPPPFPEALRKSSEGRRLEALILKAMAKSPEDRHKYVLEFSSELKAIEYGSKGLLSEFGYFSKLIAGRLKAAERKTVLTVGLLQISSIVAVLLALVISVLPYHINSQNIEVRREEQKVEICKLIFSDRIKTDDTDEIWMSESLLGNVHMLQRLCKNNPKQNKICTVFAKEINAAKDLAEQIPLIVQHDFGQEGSIGIPTFGKVKKTVRGMVIAWGQANTAASELLSLTHKRIEQRKQNLEILNRFYYSSLFLSIPTALILLLTSIKNLLDRRSNSSRVESKVVTTTEPS